MLYKETRRATSTPIYKTEVTTDADGNVKYHQTYAGQERQYNKDIYPTEYTIYAQVGVVAKMIDVNTAEVIWVGDDTQEGVSGLDALDSSAESIIKSFYKQVENAKSNSL